MNRRNYQRELTRIIESRTEKKRLFLHCCCAPCSSYVLEYLHKYFDITVFFYNPNITEEPEYEKRKAELKRFLREAPFGGEIQWEDADYEPALFLEASRGYEDEPERGARCRRCFALRLEKTAERAAAGGYDYFCTTLSISPHKDAKLLMETGENMAVRYGVSYLPSDFKKKNGYKRSIELSGEYDLYRQDYCGCIYSKKARRTGGAGKLLLMLCLFLVFSLTSCGADDAAAQKELYAMDTIMDLTLYGDKAAETMDEAAKYVHRCEKLFSVTDKESDIYKLNEADGEEVTVADETYELLEKSAAVSEKTEGLFDISIYPIVKEWGFTTGQYHVPSKERREELLSYVDYRRVKLLPGNRVRLEKGMRIDMGAIAKGYLSQKLMELFKSRGVTSAIVSLGGNVQTIGAREDGSDFRVGITDPADGVSVYGIINVRDRAVVTSGIYQRNFSENGKEYHHIMDSRTGAPAENELASVTVIEEDGAEADGLATALYVMGEEKAKTYQQAHPEISLILIRKDGSFWQSEGVKLERS